MRAMARLVKVGTETVARLLRVSGRHAARLHDAHVPDLRPLALEFDEQWGVVKTSSLSAHCPSGLASHPARRHWLSADGPVAMAQGRKAA